MRARQGTACCPNTQGWRSLFLLSAISAIRCSPTPVRPRHPLNIVLIIIPVVYLGLMYLIIVSQK